LKGTLVAAIGRLRKTSFGKRHLPACPAGDQLPWQAAGRRRRMLRILLVAAGRGNDNVAFEIQ
jgi:hypothetical protein